ncbi:MAG TPA: DASS family sodium-coupled anion symporter [bacterium]
MATPGISTSEASTSPAWYRRLGFWLGIALFVIVLFIPSSAELAAAQRMGAIAVLMACWWITEAIPIPATALIPLVLFPLLGIADAKTASAPYANHLIFLFLGGFFIALAVQKWQLHRRIAMRTISLLGFSPAKLVLGFMAATGFISMWMSNTATAMIMLPIGLAIIKHLEEAGTFRERAKLQANFGSALMFGIAYSASIGGIGTLVGTPPNLIFAGMAEELSGRHVSFTDWLMVGVPVVVIFLPLTWLYLVRFACPVWGERSIAGEDAVKQELAKLGKMTAPERRTAMIFLMTALAWILSESKDLGAFTVPGLKDIFPGISDGSITMAGALALFISPARGLSGPRLLDWGKAKEISWGILLLFGGGLALADGFQQTGLDRWMGAQLQLLQGFPHLLTLIVMIALVVVLTEVASNTAVTAMILPICAGLAKGIGADPLFLMLPAAIAASCGFMLPVGTPPNALIFASGYVTVTQMARIGIVVDILGIIIIALITYLLAIPVFHLAL